MKKLNLDILNLYFFFSIWSCENRNIFKYYVFYRIRNIKEEIYNRLIGFWQKSKYISISI